MLLPNAEGRSHSTFSHTQSTAKDNKALTMISFVPIAGNNGGNQARIVEGIWTLCMPLMSKTIITVDEEYYNQNVWWSISARRQIWIVIVAFVPDHYKGNKKNVWWSISVRRQIWIVIVAFVPDHYKGNKNKMLENERSSKWKAKNYIEL